MIIKNAGQVQEVSSMEGTTQGCNLGMLFYSLGLTPVVRALNRLIQDLPEKLSQCWLADDASAVGKIDGLKIWFDKLVTMGEKYGYHVNESKTWIVIKNESLVEKAKTVFKNTQIKFTTVGKRYLGSYVSTGNAECCQNSPNCQTQDEYCQTKVSEWCNQLEKLSYIAKTNPHAAYCAYTHSFQHKYTYFFRTIEGFEKYLEPLDHLITYGFLPTLFGSALTPTERKIVALPLRFGGMGIAIPSEKSMRDFKASTFVTSELIEMIKQQQGSGIPPDNKDSITLVKAENEKLYLEELETLKREISPQTKRCVEIACEKGASNWLSVLPLKRQGFTLNRSQFMDAINLRYYRELRGLPTTCACNQTFTITHALNCKRGGFVHMRHDNIRDFLIGLLQIVQTDVQKEPPLQPLNQNTEEIPTEIGNSADEARLDIRAKGFWRAGQDAYFDTRVTNPLAASAMKMSLTTIYGRHEKEKKRAYNHRVMTVEHGTFTPLVFSVFGTAAPECQVFLKHLLTKVADKRQEKYNDVCNWVRCKISFLCIKACLMCLRGSRAKATDNLNYVSNDFGLDSVESNLGTR
jgi:hypothetical protein